jgi:hypothetical protein
MQLDGVQLQLLMGRAVPVTVPAALARALERVEVTQGDEGRSGFQLRFRVSHAGPLGPAGGVARLTSPLLEVFVRVVLVVIVKGMPRVLMDGIVTHREHQPGDEPGVTTLTLTGEDLSVLMDRKDEIVEHPAQSDATVAMKIIGAYARHGIVPLVVPPELFDQPLPNERTPVQQGTDLEHLQALADRYGYVFYLIPGPVPLTSTAYWGPPVRAGAPQRALSVNMGPHTNVTSIDFRHDAQRPTAVTGTVQDRASNRAVAVRTFLSTRPPLASRPDLLVNRENLRETRLRGSGLSAVQARALAQARTDRSTDDVVTASGELDAARYGGALEARKLVGLRGAGTLHDGIYYVKRVTHTLARGAYTQRFTLTREGLGTTTPVVRP